MIKKWLFILSIFIVIIVLFGAVFYEKLTEQREATLPQGEEQPQQTKAPISQEMERPTATSSLKTYRNEEWGFEFEYPEEWKIIENPYGSPFSRFNLIIVPIEGRYLPDPVLVNIVTLDFADRAAISRKNLGAIESDVIIGGISGVKYQYTEQFSTISIDLPFGEYRMILGAKKQYEDVFDQFLATFKFLK